MRNEDEDNTHTGTCQKKLTHKMKLKCLISKGNN